MKKNRDGSFTVAAPGGKSIGRPGEAYWVYNGANKDGTLDVNILTKSEPSFNDYYLCTEDGKNICSLEEFDAGFEQELDYNLGLTPEEYAKQLEDEYDEDLEL